MHAYYCCCARVDGFDRAVQLDRPVGDSAISITKMMLHIYMQRRTYTRVGLVHAIR
jgi:hypothetical protein